MKTIKIILTSLIILSAVSISFGQKATEMYIPIGQSPGISGTQTLIGEIISVQGETCTIQTASGTETLTIVGHPKVWLDNSKLKSRNKYGALADMKPGMRVECKFVNPAKRDSIEWIKVEMKSRN